MLCFEQGTLSLVRGGEGYRGGSVVVPLNQVLVLVLVLVYLARGGREGDVLCLRGFGLVGVSE